MAQPRVNDDGTVTFRYQNETAKRVEVDVQFGGGRKEMTRDADGQWTVTIGNKGDMQSPVAPDMYPYCFIADGVSVMDPKNPQYFPNEGFKNSLLEVPSKTGPLPHDIRTDVAHGRIEYIRYYSKSLEATNQAVVYLPPNYMTDMQKKYPVFYLISGTTDTEEVYYKVGRVNYILDNLLAEGKAKEMIVVLPYGNPMKLKAQDAPTTVPGATTKDRSEAMAAAMRMGDVFSKDLINDLMPYIENTYRTKNDRDSRAIGGFSRGGNQALYNGLTNLDKFSYLCSYSSFTSTDIPDVYDHAAETNKKIHLFWLGVGTDDFLYGNARDYMQFLDEKGIHSVKEFTTDKFGHTWMNAKHFLAQTLPLLFNKKAAEAAMKDAKPAPAATGQEQQFTPGVMARLFPKSIISPENTEQGITFRFRAPEAKKVELDCEIFPAGEATGTVAMERDSDGVWSITRSDILFETFEYRFIVDGTPVADPSNMYLSPEQGFKYSVADNPHSPFNFASQGNIPHGRTSYDLDRGEAWYTTPMPTGRMVMPAFIQLVPGRGDTMESWFKVGGADAIADRLLADGKTKHCVITTSTLDFMQGMPQMPGFGVKTLKADDYRTWSERRRALVKLLLDIGKEQRSGFPGMGGFGGPGGGFGGGPGGGFGGGDF